jgi:hypothetical protein
LFSLDEILAVLSSPMRRRILELLSESTSPLAYTRIWERFDLPSTGALNHHLQALIERGLIARQSSGYVLTPRGKMARAVSSDLEDSYRKHALGQGPGGEELGRSGRSIQVRTVENGDVFRYVLKAGSISSKGPLSEERVKRELDENRDQWISMEAQGTHGRRYSSVLNLMAVEDDHCVGNVSGREERIEEVGVNRIVVDNIASFGDPAVGHELVTGLVEYARRRGVNSILFCLDDPEDQDEASILRNGGRLCHEARHRFFHISP